MAQADSRAPIDVVARVCADSSLLVREVGLGGEGVNPSPHKVGRHRIIHEQVGYADTVAVLGDMNVYLVA